MKKINLILTAVLFTLLLCSGQARAAIREGQWTMTTTIRMDGMDDQDAEAMREMENMPEEDRAMMESMMGSMGMKMGRAGGGTGFSATITQCITNDNPVPQSASQKNCEETHSVRGNTVKFEVTCPSSHSAGEVTYTDESMNGTITSTSTENGQEITSTIDISGEYAGPCDQAMISAPLGRAVKSAAIPQKNIDLPVQTAGNPKEDAPTLDDVNKAVSATNNVKNTFNGLKSIFGR